MFSPGLSCLCHKVSPPDFEFPGSAPALSFLILKMMLVDRDPIINCLYYIYVNNKPCLTSNINTL